MQGLAVKDVEFNGAVLRAAQVEDVIWVGVKWVCDGLGLSEGQIKRERKRLQEDLILSKGGTKFSPPYKWRESRNFVPNVRLSSIMVSKNFYYTNNEKRKSGIGRQACGISA